MNTHRREKHMLRYALVLSSLIGAILLAVPQVMSQGIVEGFRLCPGDFALCAASICTPTGGTIEVKTADGTAVFPEAQCICPIFRGPSIADVSGGNMGTPLGPGNCTAPTIVNGMPVGDDGIWSLYRPRGHIPQEINDWSRRRKLSAAPFNTCPASTTDTFANCFSFACVRAGEINGVKVATCFCPIAESLTGGKVPLGTPFGTQAGQGSEDICSQLPVGATIPFNNN
jgi:hypothetical protein